MKKLIDLCTAQFNMATLPLRDARLNYRAWKSKLTTNVETGSDIDCCFQCCVQRTGSRWLLKVLCDPLIYQFSGLTLRPFPPLFDRVRRDASGEPRFPGLPHRSILGPLYYSFEEFEKIPKDTNYRAFFVIRDPRDVVVSYYFATRDSHRLNPQIFDRRYQLISWSEREGIQNMIKWLSEDGMFDAMEQWLDAYEKDQSGTIRVFKYEDLTGEDQSRELKVLLEFMGIKLPKSAFDELTERYSLTAMRGGKTGETVKGSHYRTGRSGDWEKHLDRDLLDELLEAMGAKTKKLYAIS